MTDNEWEEQVNIYNHLTKKEQKWINPNPTYDRPSKCLILYNKINEYGFICAYQYTYNSDYVGFEIAVKKQYRNNHLASKWIFEMIVFLLQRGYTKFMTCVNDYNLPSKHIIRDKFGFKKYSYDGHLGYYHLTIENGSDFIANKFLFMCSSNNTNSANKKRIKR